jgi:hypothetical protein
MILVTRRARASEAPYETCTARGRPTEFVPIDVKKKFALTRRAQLFHVSCTGFPQAAAIVALLALAASAAAQPAAAPPSLFRVFLTNGQALPSYGEAAFVGDRVVFTMLVGHSIEDGALQLMSLPASAVDRDRTSGYARAVRASHYAATRGEADFVAISAEVEKSVARLLAVDSAAERLRLAGQAKRRLLDWSAEHYDYRAADILVLAGLFDDVIAELEAGAGAGRFAFELDSAPPAARQEPLLPAPDVRESLTLALVAAAAADVAAERKSLLKAVAAEIARTEGLEDLSPEVDRRLAAEGAVDAAYAALSRDLVARADRLVARGDVAAMLALLETLAARDRDLGGARPADVAALRAWLDDRLAAARRHRLALDRYRAVRDSLLAYERAVRAAMSDLDGLAPVLDAIRDQSGPSVERLSQSRARLERVLAALGSVTPPDPVDDVHATLVSAAHLAREACDRRIRAVATVSLPAAEAASTAASGALLLAAQGRATLIERLFPPKVQ